jgi:hypothetical protein
MSAAQYEALIRDRDHRLRTGSVVRLRPEYQGRTRKVPRDQAFVVIADKFEKVNCIQLGGNPRGEYLRIPAPWVEVIDATKVIVDGKPAALFGQSIHRMKDDPMPEDSDSHGVCF